MSPNDFEQFCTLLEADPEFQDIERRPNSDPSCRRVYFRARGHDFSVMWLFLDNYNEMTLWTRNEHGPVFYIDSCALADLGADPVPLLKTWLNDETLRDDALF